MIRSLFQKSLVSAGVAALLAACGGGGEPPAAAQATQPAAAPRAAPLAATAGAPTASNDELFDWAERQYPQLFPLGATTRTIEHEGRGYVYRYYAATDNYLGTVNGGRVYGLGGYTEGRIQDLGSVESYLCQLTPERCRLRPEVTVRVVIEAESQQCKPASGPSLMDVRRRLSDAGIGVLGSDCGYARGLVPSVCGYWDARYWMFDIDAKDEAAALQKGFKRTDELLPGVPSALACSY